MGWGNRHRGKILRRINMYKLAMRIREKKTLIAIKVCCKHQRKMVSFWAVGIWNQHILEGCKKYRRSETVKDFGAVIFFLGNVPRQLKCYLCSCFAIWCVRDFIFSAKGLDIQSNQKQRVIQQIRLTSLVFAIFLPLLLLSFLLSNLCRKSTRFTVIIK